LLNIFYSLIVCLLEPSRGLAYDMSSYILGIYVIHFLIFIQSENNLFMNTLFSESNN